jgi:hypothetical protein
MAWMTERAPATDPTKANIAGADRDTGAACAFLLDDVEPPRPRIVRVIVAALASATLVAPIAVAVRARASIVFGFALLAACIGALVVYALELRRRRRGARTLATAPRIVIDATSIVFVDGDATSTLVRIDAPVGATLFATPARDHVVLALTHRDGVAFLGGRSPSGRHRTDLLARAMTTPASDLPIAPEIPVFHRADRLLDLVAALEDTTRGALDRVFLSDASMGDVVLDGGKLRAGQLDFDLKNKLNWRSFTFQEGSALAASCYQATSIRQGDREVVLVALSPTGDIATPSIVGPPTTLVREGPLGCEEIQRALARDLRLARGLADMPPARSQRIAVDRLFMPRLRLALDAAPQDRIPTPMRVSTPMPSEAPVPTPDGIDQMRSSRP